LEEMRANSSALNVGATGILRGRIEMRVACRRSGCVSLVSMSAIFDAVYGTY
jgi:hypothetical protein